MILYKEGEYKFLSDGEYSLDKSVTNPKVIEELNNIFNLELNIHYNFGLWAIVKENMLIKANTPEGEQPFRIKVIKKDMNELYIFARHIFFDFEDNFIEDTNIVGKNGAAAINQILSNTQYPHRFKGYSDIGEINNCRIVRVNGVSSLLGKNNNTFINRWGGEIRLNKWDIHFNKKRGNDNGVEILYRKNLLGIEAEIDTESVVTRIMPMAYNGRMIPEKYVDSTYIGNYPNPKIRKVEFSDIKLLEDCTGDEEGYATLEALYEALREECRKLYEIDMVDIPKANYKVNFVELSKTLQYKNYAVLERVQLGDIVKVFHEDIGIGIEARVISYEYDPVKDEYTNIELGNFKETYFSQIDKIKDTIDKIVGDFDTEWDKILQEAIDNATELINAGLGGYVVKRRNELLIMDTEDINTAKNVWRWNINGLGFSSNGYKGPYATALTNDGKIVLTEATVTVINAALVKVGTLSSADGKTWINLDSGTFNLANKIIYDGANCIFDFSGNDVATSKDINSTKTELRKDYQNATVTVNGKGIDVNNGGLQVKNSNGVVVIDGSSNIFKIFTSFDINIDSGNTLTYVYRIRHGLGYVPAYSAFQVGTVSVAGDSTNTMLPALNISDGGDGALGFKAIIRANADENDIIITYTRASTNILANIRIKVFVFKEALL